MQRSYLEPRHPAGMIVKVFLAGIKVVFILLALVVGVLITAQSSIAPVSVRLLTSYGMEYSVHMLKPLRAYFPTPYVVEFETH